MLDGSHGPAKPPRDGQAMDLLLLGTMALRLFIPSVGLFLLLCQLLQYLLRNLFARLQASSFLESRSGYQAIPDPGEPIPGRPSTSSAAAAAATSSSAAATNGRISLPPDENGILPVVVPVTSIRRGLIYSLFSLAIFSYLVEGALLIAHSLISMEWESHAKPSIYRFEEYHVLGTAVALSTQVLYMAWQERSLGLGKFKRTYPILMAICIWAGEVALLGLIAKILVNITHYGTQEQHRRLHGWTVGHLVIQGFRILVLSFLLLSFTPWLKRTDFMPNEYSAILAESEANASGNGSAQSSRGPSRAGYGTFGGAQGQKNGAAGPNGQAKKGNAPLQDKNISFLRRMRVLGPYLWPKKSRTLQVVALICLMLLGVGRVVNVFVPRTYGRLIEDLTNMRAPWANLLLYAGLRFLQGNGGLTQVLGSNLWIPVAQYSEREMSMMTFSHLLNLSLSFQVRKKTGEVLRTLDRGSAINSFFQTLLFQLVPIGVDIIIAILYFWIKFDVGLALLVAVVMIAYVVASIILTNLRVKLRRDMNDKDKYTRGILADALGAWETIKYFSGEEREMKRYTNALKAYQKSEFKVIASLNFLNLLQNGIISLGLLIGALIVAFTVVQGTRTVGDFAMFLMYLTQLYGPLNILGTLYRVIQMNITDTDNLMKLLAEEKEIVDKPDAEELTDARGDLELDHVNFSYDGRMTALKDLTVKIPAGTSVALVGESGAGKSTLLRLLYRFYEVTGGAIRIDGKDIRDITQLSLRKAIGVVPQEAVLFNESIAYNIGYGKEGATQAEIEEAAKAARIYDRIQTFPDGWDTIVGERGVRLSGGEKQRVSIARAILKNPAILLLDEATSALDTQTEREIQGSLQTLAQGRTSIAIAHRLSTITYSDLILVLKDGEIAERGDHKTLLAMKGLYYNLWQKQIRAEEEGTVDDGKDTLKLPISGAASRPVTPGSESHMPTQHGHGHP
ncbi:hypothetical protein P389DRAFT_192735 [Cystobasidium minutum MCA 4210]|uniref:uncharacterized protein n=1 Tax=Cystobasidium minutum MCA 4210 TaxID=1397322 RepID=UPI0034CF0A74|eukprot:jgi/Rhomi1/192735/gm1.949_g